MNDHTVGDLRRFLAQFGDDAVIRFVGPVSDLSVSEAWRQDGRPHVSLVGVVV